MTDENIPSPQRSWLEWLTQAFSRDPQDPNELIEILREAQHRHIITEDALSMIESVLQVSNMQVRDIMIPRSQMIVVIDETPPKEFLPQLIESGHSRFPVVERNEDSVIGILLAKDLLSYDLYHKEEDFDIHDIIRPTVFVPESKRLDILLKEFRVARNHMAIVVDEYGGTAGLVTIEDVLEQIVGEIEDEHDIDDEDFIKSHPDGSYIVKAHTSIEDFNTYFHTQYSDEEFDTIGGLVMQAFGRLPQRDDKTTLDDFQFKILHADNRRIRLMQVVKINK